MRIEEAIGRVCAGESLAMEEIASVFGQIMAGEVTDAQLGGLLIGLRVKGETADEIAGAATTMRRFAGAFGCDHPEIAVDTCGTGGDGSGTINVSTLAAIIAAAAGATVAKHGNRAQSSKSGSADVLEELGVKIDASTATAEKCLRELGITFLFAPAFHAATRHAAPARKQLGVRTIFNLLGPLTNPAGVANQIVGVFARHWCRPVAEALGHLGARHAFVVHGTGGIDEIAVRGETVVAHWDRRRRSVEMTTVTPATFGVSESDPAELAGGDAATNASIIRSVLEGASGAPRAAAVMEAAVALVACGRSADFLGGARAAEEAIDAGRASRLLNDWVRVSQS